MVSLLSGTSKAHFPLEVAQEASGSGELEAKRSTCLPGIQRGSRKGFSSQPQYDRWLLGGLSRREHPVAIRFGGCCGYRLPALKLESLKSGAMVRSTSGDQPFNSRSGRYSFRRTDISS